MARAARRQGESQHHKRRSSQAHSAPLAQMNLNAAGIEVGATEHWVAVPEDRDEEPVRFCRKLPKTGKLRLASH